MASSTAKVGRGVAVVVGLTVMALVVSLVLPVGIDAMTDGQATTFTQNEGETVEVNSQLNGTLDVVDSTNNTVDLTLNDTETGETRTITGLAVNSSATVTLNEQNVTATNEEIVDTTTARVTYEHPDEYTWSSGARSLVGVLDLIIVLVVFLTVIGWAVTQF